MAVHFLSVLGTSFYEPVVYKDADFTSGKQEYIQLAILEKFREELTQEGTKITIFLTEGRGGSRAKNWEDRTYGEFDINQLKKWKQWDESIQEGMQKKGLYTQIKEQFPELAGKCQDKSIASAGSEKEIWEVFQSILESLGEGDEIIFDITHSFRSIPMLAMTVINYAKVLKNCKLKGIYYGAYDPTAPASDADKEVQIVDLTVYNEILEWTNAANTFMNYGIAEPMQQLFTEKMLKTPKEDRKAWGPIKSLVDSATALASALQTSRGVSTDFVNVKRGKEQYSIQAAAKKYRDRCGVGTESTLQGLQPLYPLLERTAEAYKGFNQEGNYRTGIQVVRWCISHNMTQQGYTALEETIKTYLCEKYDLDEMSESERDYIVGEIINIRTHEKQSEVNRKLAETEIEAKSLHYLRECLTRKGLETKWNTAEKIYKEINPSLVTLAGQVKDDRNDINHFGIRPNPLSADSLKARLEENYRKFFEIINAEENKVTEDGE